MHPAPWLLAVLPHWAVVTASSSSSSSGCGTSAPIPLSKLRTAHLSPGNRTFMYFLPATYDPDTPTPLILSFHGGGQSAELQADLDELTNPFFNTDHILVYPQALELDSSISWQGSPGTDDLDDISYVGDVLDIVEAELCIDLTRVYATGKSEGGNMANLLACDYASSQRIAAFAPVSGAFYLGVKDCSDSDSLPTSCNASRTNIPMMEFHGGNDQTISIDGGDRKGDCLPSIAHWVHDWVRRDGMEVSTLAVEGLRGSASIRRYGSGNESGLVTWVYDGDKVDHDWPATFSNKDNTNHDSGPATFNASTMIMEWFAQFTLPLDDSEDACPSSTTSTGAACSSTATATTTTPTATPSSAGNRGAGSVFTNDRLLMAVIWAFMMDGLFFL